MDTGALTTLCRVPQNSYPTPVVDWSGGPPAAGTFCTGPGQFFGWVETPSGDADAIPTWTGLAPRTAAGVLATAQMVAGGGAVIAMTDAANIIPGFVPTTTQLYVWDYTAS